MKHKKSKLASSGHGGTVEPEITTGAMLERERLRLSLKKRGRRLRALKRELRHGKNMEALNNE